MSTNITLGIIGSGQLGSLLCQAAKKLKVKTIVISDDKNGPAQKFCDKFVYSTYDNLENIQNFVEKVDIVTYEFENIPFNILQEIEKKKIVLPKSKINRTVQDRKKEKTFINSLGIKTTEWAFIKSSKDIFKNINLLPGILKTNTLGYDGRGQFVINSLDDVKKDWCFTADYILEKKVDLKKEISVIMTRFQDNTESIYEPIENVHKDQILNNSKIPADINSKVFEECLLSTKKIAKNLDYVGTICVEFFLDKKNNLLVNEIAPRVHNSGHLTINSHNISQFESHIRAVCNLENMPIKKIANAEMINILGKQIDQFRIKSYKKNEFFFDYFKKEPKEKRKMGHLTILKNEIT